MKIIVKAKAGVPIARQSRIFDSEAKLRLDRIGTKNGVVEFNPETGVYKVWVKEKAIQGRANDAVVRALAKHFKVPVARVIIKSGKTSKKKIIEIK